MKHLTYIQMGLDFLLTVLIIFLVYRLEMRLTKLEDETIPICITEWNVENPDVVLKQI